ncbi:P-loop containing nucleoside triphosphate hydrolase protein [Kockovaella imperatae]|uniref:p-loop containing nucleoside triphosphate hydrolase protein n=1 Tax=Kockovaella imperatae TaxID=4999 RepID=A0A1Y1UE19_9TREE|nr:P-loop containing nucleoside triphosphate hydrolase protein [Kockovaella imperatae]ORX36262.1 P-loop containing nucleoside triphosphate hydrolase protein [Kockovaella imperatae]
MDVNTEAEPPVLGPPIIITRSRDEEDGDKAPSHGIAKTSMDRETKRDSLDVPVRRSSHRHRRSIEAPKRTSSLAQSPVQAAEQPPVVSKVEEQPEQSEAETRIDGALLKLPPPPPFDLLVNNLCVGIPHKKASKWLHKKPKSDEAPKKQFILQEINSACQSGQVLAILGGSGSGKTTLLNAIAHRLAGLPITEGQVVFQRTRTASPSTLSGSEIKRRIGFVRQQDHLVECLTVRETLSYAARLRLPKSLDEEVISLIVEETIDELGLRDAADTVVGGPLRKGISGGEKRRLSIGCVLVTLPSVLILDEPTSGLDAFTSYLLLQTLSHLARRGRTIILSIHAPRSDAFPLFDRITLLSKGEVVYSGLRSCCLSWFKSLGHEVDQGTNPLDFLIDISSVDNRDPEKEEISLARVRILISAWKERPNGDPLQLEKRSISSDETENRPTNELERFASIQSEDSRRAGFFRQTAVLTSRAHKSVYRNYVLLVGFLTQAVVLGLVIGLNFYQLPATPTGIQSLKNLTFQLIPGVFYLTSVFWIYKYCTDLLIFDREREDHMYSVVPYILSDFLSFLVPSVLWPTIYIVLVYFLAGLRKDQLAARLFTMTASTISVQFAVQGISLLAASIFRSFAGASMVGNALNLFQLVSAGFLVVHVPAYVKWVRWISPFFYSFRIVATIQFKDRQFDCPAESAANLNQCNGNNVLNGFKFDAGVNIGAWFGGLLGLAIAWYTLACLVLWLWPSGGVKHASEIESHHRGKGTDVMESHMTRDRIDVELRNLTFAWERHGRGVAKNKEKIILDNLSIQFPAGQISAILGPSGAGKSTLLQLLASRMPASAPMSTFRTTGQILMAGQPVNAKSKSNVAFVEQDDDWHLPSLTVRETLRYAAILRLPSKMSKASKIARAETVLLMLGLKDCADLPVGGALLKGISGGEKRRLSLAVQMINDPAVLVVDEPTSGLDSSIALSVMQVLRDIAATGRTVIATIHQPRSDIWRLADNVTLLAKGGRLAYTGTRADAIPYFVSIGHPMPSEFFNPADHLLDLVSIDPRPAAYPASNERVRQLTDHWKRIAHTPDGGESEGPTLARGHGSTSMRVALPVVLERHWKNLWRRKDVFFNRLVQTPLLAGMFILFFQRLSHGPSGAQDRIGLTIENTTAAGFVGLLNAMAIYPADRDLYLHEAKSSARYSPATFVIVWTIVELGFELLGAFGYAAIINVGAGMQTSVRIFFEFSLTIWACVNLGESWAMMFGAWIPAEGLTVVVVSTLLSIAGQISGVISLSVPTWLSAIAWATPIKSATRAQIINEAVGLKFYCTQEQLASGACVAQNGEQLLALFHWSNLNTSTFMGLMVGIAVAWRIVAWASIAARVRGVR